MNAIGMTAGEQQQFANAMFQLDAARRSSVNQNPTGITFLAVQRLDLSLLYWRCEF